MVERDVRSETGAYGSVPETPKVTGTRSVGDCRRDGSARPHGRKLAVKSFVKGSKQVQRVEEVLKS